MPDKDFEWTKKNIIKTIQNKDIKKLEKLDVNGHTALIRAALAFPELISKLVNMSVDINQQEKFGKTAIMMACQHNLESFDILINHPDIDLTIQNEFNETVLINSIEHYPKNTKTILEQKNVNINAQDNFGETALMVACNFAPETILDFYHHIELDFDIKNNEGNTAWDIAKKLDNGSYKLLKKCFLKYKTIQKEAIEKSIINNKTSKIKPLL